MRKNKVKEMLKNKKLVLGTFVIELRSPGIAQMLATAGLDCVFIDSEHSSFSIENIGNLILGCKAVEITSIVRVPSKKSFDWMLRSLDSGAQGLLIPHVETSQEVKEIVKATKYYPLGERGVSLELAHSDFNIYGNDGKASEIMNSANRETMIGIQIESVEAVEAVDDILSVQGIDFVLVGPNDLSQSMGLPGQLKNPKLVGNIRKVIASCQKHGVTPAIALPGDMNMVKMWIGEGMKLIAIFSDIGIIVQAVTDYVNELRDFREECP